MKDLKINRYDGNAAAIITFAIGLRVLLDALGWPPTNTDETTMAIMSLNIAYRGAHPLMFYGQNYMGVLEAYLGAFFYHICGTSSLFILRLGVILLVGLFFITLYLLTALLFSKQLGLVILTIFSFGSIPFLTRQIIATGGTSQTLFFGTFAFLLATFLSLTYRRGLPWRTRLWRLVGYAVFGLVIGLGLWSDMVVVPAFAMAVLLLLVFCWRELLFGAILIVVPMVTVGMTPTLIFSQRRQLSPVDVLLGLFRGSDSPAPHTLHGLLHNIIETVQVTIPTATGNPFCPVSEMYFLGDNSPHTRICTIVHGVWSGGYLIVLGIAFLFILHRLWSIQFRQKNLTPEMRRQALVRAIASLFLLGMVAINILVFAVSSAASALQAFHARYLICLLIATPVLLAPLWEVARQHRWEWTSLRQRLAGYGSRTVLVTVWLCFFIGTIIAFSEIPAAHAEQQRRADLIQHLKQIGATRIYTEYWTCNNLIFESHEQVICAVLNYRLESTHDRAPGYAEKVRADPHAAYVFPIRGSTPIYNGLPAVEEKFSHAPPGSYRRYEFDGYVIYQPI